MGALMGSDDEDNHFMEEDQKSEEDKDEHTEPRYEAKGTKGTIRDFEYDVLTGGDMLSFFKSKCLQLKNRFDFSDIENGVFLRALRSNRFMVSLTARKLEDTIFDYLESSTVQTLDSAGRYECGISGEECSFHETTHFGCGHTFSKEMMQGYIINEIESKGKNSIFSTCPAEDCGFLLSEELVSALCPGTALRSFQQYLVLDFIENYPCALKCCNPSCELYATASEITIKDDHCPKLPAKDCICECGWLNCFHCKAKGHQPLRCQDAKLWDEEMDEVVDKLNLQWKKNNTKKCPKCKLEIFKNTGCMHMNCFNCKFEFCWLCLKGKDDHGGGHMGSCSIKDEAVLSSLALKAEDDSQVNKLKFCMDRFLEHLNSLKIALERYSLVNRQLAGKDIGNTSIKKFNDRYPNSLAFYKDSYKTVIAARSFLMYTYPLEYKIRNQKEMMLFIESQNLFQVSLDNLTGYIEENHLESFLDDNSVLISPVDSFEKKKYEMEQLRNGLIKHCNNFREEISSDEFLAIIKEDVRLDLNSIVKKKVVAVKTVPDPGEIWTCLICSRGNKDSPECSTCRKNTYADSHGAWKCSMCSNMNARASDKCGNHYCKNGLRDDRAKGKWVCGVCQFQNIANLSDKCSACNQKTK